MPMTKPWVRSPQDPGFPLNRRYEESVPSPAFICRGPRGYTTVAPTAWVRTPARYGLCTAQYFDFPTAFPLHFFPAFVLAAQFFALAMKSHLLFRFGESPPGSCPIEGGRKMDFLTGPETYVKKERDTLKDGDSAGFILLRCDGAVNRKLHDEGAAGRGFTLISLLTTTPVVERNRCCSQNCC